MTPEERNLVTDLFDRLATLEDAQRDPEAERLIGEGLRHTPNAPYALVQTVLVQDEALKRADARIRELEAGATESARDSSFLGSVREERARPAREPRLGALGAAGRGSAGQVAGLAGRRQPRNGGTAGPGAAAGGAGGSFLGTAAAAAAGVIGGSLLLGSIRSMMGNRAARRPPMTRPPVQAARRRGAAGASAAASSPARPGSTMSGADRPRLPADGGGQRGFGLLDDRGDAGEHSPGVVDDDGFDFDLDGADDSFDGGDE